MDSNKPVITPASLLGHKNLPAPWDTCQIAIVCYTPCPDLSSLEPKTFTSRYFLHSPTSEVKFILVNEIPIIVISEVYGGVVASTTIEELSHYGIKKIIGLGFVGGLDKSFGSLGDIVISLASTNLEGAGLHYSSQEIVYPSKDLTYTLTQLLTDHKIEFKQQKVWSTTAIYQETPNKIKQAMEKGCHIVNMDCSSLFSVSQHCKIQCCYLAIYSDVIDLESLWKGELPGKSNDANIIFSTQNKITNLILNSIQNFT